jgi:hypothetical protein
MPSSTSCLIRGVFLCAVLQAWPAFASGMVVIPETTRTFESQAACRQSLVHQIRIHQKIVTPGRALPSRIGDTHLFKELKTSGVEDQADGTTRYDYELWTHASRRDAPNGKYSIAHSYERRVQVCRDGVLTVSGANGYTQPTFADQPLTSN